jgi:hypothetical protein
LDSGKIREELEGGGQRKWVCAGNFNSHHSIWDGTGREPSGRWREVKEIIDAGRLMIEPGTPTWKGGQSNRSSTIDLVIASNSAQVSMVEIATYLYTGSDHETLCWEINDGGNDKWETHTVATPRWKIDVIYEGEQWIVDQIQKVAVRIAKDVAGLKATTAGCDAIRSADIPPTRAMLDRRTERHFMRMLTQNNPNSDLVPDEADGMVDEEDIPSLESWIERTGDDLWVLGDEVERSVPVDLEFAP